MKTAVSIPDDLFEKAERVAKRKKMTRSKLFATALAEFVDRYDDAEISAAIDAFCKTHDTSLDPALKALRNRALVHTDDEW